MAEKMTTEKVKAKKEVEIIRVGERKEFEVSKDVRKLGWKKGDKVAMHPKTAEGFKKRGLVK